VGASNRKRNGTNETYEVTESHESGIVFEFTQGLDSRELRGSVLDGVRGKGTPFAPSASRPSLIGSVKKMRRT
jgi:hypothetical protein